VFISKNIELWANQVAGQGFDGCKVHGNLDNQLNKLFLLLPSKTADLCVCSRYSCFLFRLIKKNNTGLN